MKFLQKQDASQRPKACCVTEYAFSVEAERDLIGVYLYTLRSFGTVQADKYIEELRRVCAQLAILPGMGRTSNYLPSEVRRHEHTAHVVFYREDGKRIVIVRILGRQQQLEIDMLDTFSDVVGPAT